MCVACPLVGRRGRVAAQHRRRRQPARRIRSDSDAAGRLPAVRERVAQLVRMDRPDAGRLPATLEHLHDAVTRQGAAVAEP